MNADAIKSLRRVIRQLKTEAKGCYHMAAVAPHEREFWQTRENALLLAIEIAETEILRQRSENVR